MLAIGVDVGGTKVTAGLVDESGSVRKELRRETPDDPAATTDVIAALVAELAVPGAPVGIGVAGFIAADASTVALAPNLGWRDEPLGERLAARLGVAVRVENDANSAAWAESRFGASVGRGSSVCVTVGTGVGGGIVMGGQLCRGAFGMAGELGHVEVVAAGLACGCGRRGCLEQYASGRALVRRGRQLVAQRDPSAGALREACGDRAADLTGPMITEVAASGDSAGIGLIREIGEWLGSGLAGLATTLDPECFVIGGGVLTAGELLLGPVRESFSRRMPADPGLPVAEILAANFGNDAGVVGAADLARAAAAPTRS